MLAACNVLKTHLCDSKAVGSKDLVKTHSQDSAAFVCSWFSLLPVPSESLCKYSPARVVPRVQPEDGAGCDGGGLSEWLQGRFPRRAAPHCQHGRRQRQHGLALQRFTLQLPRGQEAPGCRWMSAGRERLVVGVRRERELGQELPWHLIFTEKSSQSKEFTMENYVMFLFPVQFPGSNIVSIFISLELERLMGNVLVVRLRNNSGFKKNNPPKQSSHYYYLEPAPRTLGTDLPGYCFCFHGLCCHTLHKNVNYAIGNSNHRWNPPSLIFYWCSWVF